MDRAVALDIMLHSYMLLQSGIPMLYSGDEIGQVNDYTYKENPAKREDSRYIHRGTFIWKNARRRGNKNCVEGKIFQALDYLEKLRKQECVFDEDAQVSTVETGDKGIICIIREKNGEKMAGRQTDICVPGGNGKRYDCRRSSGYAGCPCKGAGISLGKNLVSGQKKQDSPAGLF